MTIDYYYSSVSAPCRSVLLLSKSLNIDFNLKEMHKSAGDFTKPEFLKINYQHTVPTIVDDGFILWESRAILAYLVEKYAKNDALYPKDPQKRARVNQMLYFDMGTLHQRLSDYYYKPIMAKTPFDPAAFTKMEEAVAFLNTGLEGQKYTAGDTLTIADFALVATVSNLDGFKYNLSKYPNVTQWYERCKKTMPGYEVNQKALDELIKKISPMLPK
uniref:glutathione transferase n=1 Tax=Nyssomyia neivai TaxID=330878 RepID=A0A1L8E4N2_9DIPT